jgi:PAS domain S-box-containing protein
MVTRRRRSSTETTGSLLRRQAEARLGERPSTSPPQTLADASRLVHELQVHQLELEIQNEELRRIQQELETSQRKYFDLYDLAPVGYLTICEDKHIVETNFAAAQLLGVERAALARRRFSDFIHRDDRQQFDRLCQSLASAPPGQVTEVRLAGKREPPRWVRIEATMNPPSRDEPPSLRAVVTDISALKVAETALRERIDLEERLTKFAANAPGAIFQYRLRPDGSSTFPYTSAGIQALFGLAPEELVRDAAALVARIHPDDQERLIASRQESQRTLSNWRDEHRVQHPETGEIWVELRATPEREADGSVSWYGFVADITERKRAEQMVQNLAQTLEQRVSDRTAELSASNRELASFSYSVSHDLRAPLRALDGFSYLLAEECGKRPDAPCRDYLHRIRQASQHLGNVIDDMLDLASVGREPLKRGAVDLSVLGDKIAQNLQAQAQQRRVEWTIAEGLVARADPRLMSILLGHLLGNAWKFTGEQELASIELGSSIINATLTFYVRDNGVGFDMTYAHNLFQPFQRLHEPARFEGTGIGLAIVQRIIYRHGGRIWAESAVGHGATLFFTLP